MRILSPLPNLAARLVGFRHAIRGNLTITFAFAAMPILFALGAAADYGIAVKGRSRMDAAADAAALAAVTPQQMTQPTAIAGLAAANMFNAQVSSMSRIAYVVPGSAPVCVSGPNGYAPPAGSNLCVSVTDSTVNNQRVRTATVAYTATSQTAFTKILRMPTIAIAGTSTATASTSPNIDFYLMLDTSPSMAIPATQDGINRMVSFTPYQDSGSGCAFACHETLPQNEAMGTPSAPKFGNPGCPDDPQKRKTACVDNYWFTQNPPDNKGTIALRMDLVNQAVVNLISSAQSTSTQTGAAYRLAAYTFDRQVSLAVPLQTPSSTAQTQAKNNIQMMIVPYENTYYDSNKNIVSNSDMDTDFDTAFAKLKSDMTNAGVGNGTNTVGDKPQQVLMIVTDGVSDESYQGGGRIYNPLGGTTNTSSDMTQTCSDFKAISSNVRIAVLYLTYNPLPLNNGNSWYAKTVRNVQNDILPTMKNCASPGLFYQVNTGGDVSSAMNALFQAAIKNARLSY